MEQRLAEAGLEVVVAAGMIGADDELVERQGELTLDQRRGREHSVVAFRSLGFVPFQNGLVRGRVGASSLWTAFVIGCVNPLRPQLVAVLLDHGSLHRRRQDAVTWGRHVSPG